MNGPSVLGSDAVPYEIDAFYYVGQVSLDTLNTSDSNLSGTFLPPPPPAGQHRTDELPMSLAIVNFPG